MPAKKCPMEDERVIALLEDLHAKLPLLIESQAALLADIRHLRDRLDRILQRGEENAQDLREGIEHMRTVPASR